jgi:hypothetical protein
MLILTPSGRRKQDIGTDTNRCALVRQVAAKVASASLAENVLK